MRLVLLLLAVVLLMVGCAPTMRQILIHDTAVYTQCDHVEVECVDEDCSNVQGGPWMATACGTRYRCTNTGGHVACVPTPQSTQP
jgi:hypothetical protein